jgi:hypothetical protein
MDNIIPSTAGTVLTEARLRAYTKCSQFYFYGGETQLPDKIAVLEQAYARSILELIQKPDSDPTQVIAKMVIKTIRDMNLRSKYLEAEIPNITRSSVLLLHEVLKKIPPSKYLPVYSVFEYRTKVSKTPIDIKVSALLRSRENRTIHIVVFSPYKDVPSIKADPTHLLHLTTLAQLANKDSSLEHPSILHIFGLTQDNEFLYVEYKHNQIPEQRDRVKSLIQSIEQGHHYPLVPCTLKCKYKLTCKVE